MTDCLRTDDFPLMHSLWLQKSSVSAEPRAEGLGKVSSFKGAHDTTQLIQLSSRGDSNLVNPSRRSLDQVHALRPTERSRSRSAARIEHVLESSLVATATLKSTQPSSLPFL